MSGPGSISPVSIRSGSSSLRVRVLGAGIVGLAVAEELVRRGHRVSVWDPSPGSGASHAAAGMLSPAGEAWHGEADLLGAGRESARLWPGLAARLGMRLDTAGTLLVGHDAGDLQELARQAELLSELGEPVEPVARRALTRVEPCLGRAAGGFRLPDDLAVDPRAVVRALLARLRDVVRPDGWDLEREPTPGPDHDAVVVATGSRLPAPFDRLVRGVRGEVLRVRCDDPPRHVLRGLVRGRPVYLVPRADGEVVVGATVEEHDAAAQLTAGGVHRLLDDARVLLPALDRATWLEATSRDRPGTRDNRPLVGPTHLPGVLLAAGHHRSGVLLAPLTARLVADHLESGTVHHPWDPRRNP